MNINNHITVGIPFYNKSNSEHLDLAIKSIVEQTLQPKKIHLIQDGEVTAKIKKVINKYIYQFPNMFDLLKLPKRGLPYALNQSIKLCKTKYYARMDSDDISTKNRFKVQLDCFNKNPEIEILGSWAIEFNNDHLLKSNYISKMPNDIQKIKEYLHYRNPLVHSSVIFRANVFKKISMYNENFLTDQDHELWSRAIKRNVKISNIQSPLLYLRVEDRHKRRSKFSAIKRQIIIRYSYNTSSFKLNVLKLAAIILRLLPFKIVNWSYKNLRDY